MSQSLLTQAYAKGLREGHSQAGQVRYDEAHQRGLDEGRAEAPSRFRWFLTGFLSAGLLVVLTTL